LFTSLFLVFMIFLCVGKVHAKVELGTGDAVPSTWKKADSPYVIKNIITANDPVTIEPGVIVKFKRYASATFKKSLVAVGMESEKIVFTAYTDDEHGGDTNGDLDSTKPQAGYWFRVLISPGATAHIENAQFLYGGDHSSATLAIQSQVPDSVTVKSSEFKDNQYAGIELAYNPDQKIEKNFFARNAEGIRLGDCYNGSASKILHNAFEKNAYAARVASPNTVTLDARENWWGDKSGPYHATKNPNGKGDKISNGVIFDPWIGKESFVPTVVIPGIMGSWEKSGEWKIDPIFHTYDNLLKEFKESGYVAEKDLFTFPYEWRDSNKVNAVELKEKIKDIKSQTHFPKVNVVAHSMGGLLAREYIESDYYDDDVDKLITIGTPHLGAPKDYVTWEAGEFLGFWRSIFKNILTLEALEKGFGGVFSYLHKRPVSSVQELLPVYNYLFDDEKGQVLRNTYPDNYPRNEFLENLNRDGNLNNLNKIEFTKIVGKLNIESTYSGYNVAEGGDFGLWEHGYPKYFDLPILRKKGLKYEDGDQTVPLYSAEATEIPSDRTIYLESEHNNLPTDSQRDVLEILTDIRPDSEVREWKIDDILLGMVFSPVDVQVISPNGEKLGKNFETGDEYNEIEGAYYTGFGTDTEFFTIPNPEDGEYKILTQGTGTGEYKIEIAKIADLADGTDSAEEAETTITGNAETGKQEEVKIKIDGKKMEKLVIVEPEGNKDSSGNSENNPPEEKPASQNQTRVQKTDFLKASIRQYFHSKDIKTKREYKTIIEQLSHIRMYLKRLEFGLRNKNVQRRKANQHIQKLITRVRKKCPRTISEEVRDYIAGILEELKIE